MNSSEKEDSVTLEILETIENNKEVTQRHLADKLGVALGLANSYLKRCVRKGLIKIHQAPANRYLYYLTPKGFTEKSRLTALYLSSSFDFYRSSSESCSNLLKHCEDKQLSRLVLCGISELAEIFTLRAHEHQVKLLGFLDAATDKNRFLDMPVWHSTSDLPEFDAVVITGISNPQETYLRLSKELGQERVLSPSILGIHQRQS